MKKCWLIALLMLVATLASCAESSSPSTSRSQDPGCTYQNEVIYADSQSTLYTKVLEEYGTAMANEGMLDKILNHGEITFGNFEIHRAEYIRWYDGYGVWSGTESIELYAHDGDHCFAGSYGFCDPSLSEDPSMHIRILYYPSGCSTSSMGIDDSHELVDSYSDVYVKVKESLTSYYVFLDSQYVAVFIFDDSSVENSIIFSQIMEFCEKLR